MDKDKDLPQAESAENVKSTESEKLSENKPVVDSLLYKNKKLNDAPLSESIQSATRKAFDGKKSASELHLEMDHDEAKEKTQQQVRSESDTQLPKVSQHDHEHPNPSHAMDLDTLRKELSRLKGNLSTAERRFVNAKKVQKDCYSALQTQVDTLSGHLTDIVRSVERDRQAVDAALNDSQKLVLKHSDHLSVFKQKHLHMLQQLEAQLPKWSAQVEEKIASVDAAKSTLDGKTEAVMALENRLKTLQQELTTVLAAVNQMRTESLALEKSREQDALARELEYEQRRQAWHADQKEIQALKTDLMNVVDSVVAQRQAVMAEIDTIKQSFDAEFKSLADDREALDTLRSETKKMLLVAHAARKIAIKYNSTTSERVEEMESIAERAERVAQQSGDQLAEMVSLKAVMATHAADQREAQTQLTQETHALEKLCQKIEAQEQRINREVGAAKQCTDTITHAQNQVVDLATQVREHLGLIQGAMDQYASLEGAITAQADRIEAALEKQQHALNRVDDLANDCDETRSVVSQLQHQWSDWTQAWENMCAANDDNYRHLVALLDRSRQNEGALEQLLKEVQALESRSSNLVDSAEGQLKRQETLAEQMQANTDQAQTVQAIAEMASHHATEAADRAEACEQRLAGSVRDTLEEQKRLLAETDEHAKKIADAHVWIKQALAKTQSIKVHSENILQRQSDLEKRAQDLLDAAQLQGSESEALALRTRALADSIDARLAESTRVKQRVDEGVARVEKFLKTAQAEQAALLSSSDETQNKLQEIISSYHRMSEQTAEAHRRIQASERGVQDMLRQVATQLAEVRTQGDDVAESLKRGELMQAQWAVHQRNFERLESQSDDVLQGSQQLQSATQELLSSTAADHERVHEALDHVTVLSSQVNEAVAAEKQLREQAEALIRSLSEQRQKQETLASEQAATTLRTEVMHDQITDMEKRTTDKLAELAKVQKQAQSLLTENMALQHGLSSAQNQMTALVARADQQMGAIDAVQHKTEARFSEAQNVLDELAQRLPQLAENMTHFEKMSEDYHQWEPRLNEQSQQLKDSENHLREWCQRLDDGLKDVAVVDDKVKGVLDEFGNIKRVVAQLLQKFKTLEQKNAVLEQKNSVIESQCSSLALEQADLLEKQNTCFSQHDDLDQQHKENGARLAVLEDRSLAEPLVPEPVREVVQKFEIQERFNDHVLKNFERIAQNYIKSSQHSAVMEPLQQHNHDMDVRLSRIEATLERLLNQPSPSFADDDRMVRVDQAVLAQESHLETLEQEVGRLREELIALRKTSAASESLIPANPSPLDRSPSDLAKAAMTEGHNGDEDRQSNHARMESACLKSESAMARESFPEAREDGSHVDGEKAHELSTYEQSTHEQSTLKPERENDKESDLDLLSQQLEKISAESMFWGNESEGINRSDSKKKTFLFSLLVLGGSFSYFGYPTTFENVPTFSHNQFGVTLSHPALVRMGPPVLDEAPRIRTDQRQYLHTVNDEMLSLQWPLPDREAGTNMQYGLASNAVYLEAPLHTPVLSIAPGQVVFSGQSTGQFGTMVIVQHPGELLSVYGHLDDTWVDSGQQVLGGQVIARLGTSQWSDPRLYFEIRYRGYSEDPYLYFST